MLPVRIIILTIALVRIPITQASSDSEEIDICDLRNGRMFCNCEPVSWNESGITCYIISIVDADDGMWSAFGKVNEVVVALTLTSRNPMHLEYLPVTAFRNLPQLQTISVQEGKLGSLESRSVSNMTHLKSLLLERNEISSLDRYSISHLPKLKSLILSENYLNEILADCLFDLMDLVELHLDRNNISRIETCAFCSLHNLKELVLWGNMLTDLTESMFRGLRYLTRIDLYKNRLKVLSSKVFQAMPSLQEINLKENVLEYISGQAFDGLPKLMSIQLNDNRLRTLPGTVFKYPKSLMDIDVSSNFIKTVHEDVIENIAKVKDPFFALRISRNRLKCSCDLRWVSHYANEAKSGIFIRELKQIECQTEEGENELVLNLNMSNCIVATVSTTTFTSGFTSTVEPITLKVPAKSDDDDDDDNLGCRTTTYWELYFVTAILYLLIWCKKDI